MASDLFNPTGNFAARGANKVDPRLVQILRDATESSQMRTDAFSGFRPNDSRFHGKGLATDVTLYDDKGAALKNYQSPETFDEYQKYAHAARKAQMEKYPDLADQFRWGGYFSGGKDKYGAMDLMHFDLGGSSNLGMAGGSWDGGLTDQQAKLWGLHSGAPTMQATPTPVSSNLEQLVNGGSVTATADSGNGIMASAAAPVGVGGSGMFDKLKTALTGQIGGSDATKGSAGADSPLSLIANAFKPKQQTQSESMKSIMPSVEAGEAVKSQAAATMMSQLMGQKYAPKPANPYLKQMIG